MKKTCKEQLPIIKKGDKNAHDKWVIIHNKTGQWAPIAARDGQMDYDPNIFCRIVDKK